MNERIYMDDFHYESYTNIKEALESWQEYTTNSSIEVSYELDSQVDFDGLSSIIMFDEERLQEIIGTEGLKDKVKNMASRVKSNLGLWIKKFINFFFGWIIRFFKGIVNIRKSLKSGFDKAKAYIKKMDEMSSKLGKEFKDKEGENKVVKCTDAAAGLIQALGVVLVTTWSLDKLTEMFKGLVETNEVVKEEKQDADNLKDEKKVVQAGAELLIKQLMVGITATGSLIAMINPLNNEFYTKIQKTNYNLIEYLNGINTSEDELEKTVASVIKSTVGDVAKVIVKFIKALFGEDSAKEEALKQAINDVQVYKEAVSTLKKVLGDSAERVTVNEPEEKPYNKAFMQVKHALTAFVTLAQNNKKLWNFELVAQKLEKVKRKLISKLSKDYTDYGNDEGEAMFNEVVATGQLMAAIANNTQKCMQSVNSLLDAVITDAARLGAGMTSVSDKN
nr:MAG TPA: internal head protein [Caudoviricetes sp.]